MDAGPEDEGPVDDDRGGPMTPGWSAATLAALAVLLLVASQVWARLSSGWGPLLPLVGGLLLGAVGGVVGLLGLVLLSRRRRDPLELGLCLAGVVVGVACVVLALA
jgi:hypothetical protein